MKKFILTTICVLFVIVGFAQHGPERELEHGPEGVEQGTGDLPVTVKVTKKTRMKVKPIIDAFELIQDITQENRNECINTLDSFVKEMKKVEKPLRQLADIAYVKDIIKQVKRYRNGLSNGINKINLNKNFKYYFKMN